MKYKLIVADFDGTIADSNLIISPRLKKAVNDFQKEGGFFTIATGRMTSSILPYAKELNIFDDLVSFQGAVISNFKTDKILKKTEIDSLLAFEIAKFLESFRLYYHTYLLDEYLIEQQTEYTKEYNSFTKCQVKVLNKKVSSYIQAKEISPLKFMVIAPPSESLFIYNKIIAEFSDCVLVNTSSPKFVEIINKKVNKGVAVDYIAKKLNIKQDEIICIGDSGNDIPMIKYAGLGVAVSNASNEVKEAADLITRSCSDDGVAYIIEKFGLGKNI